MISANFIFGGDSMDSHCKEFSKLDLPCPLDRTSPAPVNTVDIPASSSALHTGNVGAGGIVFGAGQRQGATPIPGYNALAPHIKPVRDPVLSLIAMSGIDPTEPVMMEVPLVLNNTTFTASLTLAGYRIGYVDRYVQGNHVESIEHSAAVRGMFDLLRQAGAQWVAVDARRGDENLQFSLQGCNGIDELVTHHRLDALVSDDPDAAFHHACRSRYPNACETLGDGSKVWFYGARWAADRLTTLLRTYRQLRP